MVGGAPPRQGSSAGAVHTISAPRRGNTTLHPHHQLPRHPILSCWSVVFVLSVAFFLPVVFYRSFGIRFQRHGPEHCQILPPWEPARFFRFVCFIPVTVC